MNRDVNMDALDLVSEPFTYTSQVEVFSEIDFFIGVLKALYDKGIFSIKMHNYIR